MGGHEIRILKIQKLSHPHVILIRELKHELSNWFSYSRTNIETSCKLSNIRPISEKLFKMKRHQLTKQVLAE